MRIGVIGGGVVGHATARAFLGHVEEVRVWDILSERRTCQHPLDVIEWADLCFVCLPTPQEKNRLCCDLGAVDGFFDTALDNAGRQRNFVLRSTVPVGTTRRLRDKYGLPNLVHSPEFLTARCAVTDAMMPARNIIGAPQRMTDKNPCLHRLSGLYERRFPGVPLRIMTSDESEFVKLAQNAHSAVKVSLFNEFRAFADKQGLDWGRCLDALLAGGWINSMHTQVPGPDGKRGFGGACLPKDLATLIDCMDRSESPADVCRAAMLRNRAIDRKEAD